MANLDTTSKRRSSVGILCPFILSPPAPDGSITKPDRQHIAMTYSGISAAGGGSSFKSAWANRSTMSVR